MDTGFPAFHSNRNQIHPNGYESGYAGEQKGPEWETMPKHRTCWISTSFSNYARIKDPLIKGNSLSPIPFAIACNYCKYWFRIREFSFPPGNSSLTSVELGSKNYNSVGKKLVSFHGKKAEDKALWSEKPQT